MHILIFYQYFGTPKGGWSTRMYEFPKKWIEAGNQVTIVTSPYDKSDIKARKFIDRQIIDGIQVIIINLKQSNKHSLLYRAFTFAMFSIISIYYAITLKFDIILCSSGPITIGLPGLFAKVLRPKKKFVFEVRDLWPEGAIQLGLIKQKSLVKLACAFEKYCYKKADLIVTCSKGMTDSIEQRFATAKCITIPNACDYDFFQETNPSFQLPNFTNGKNIFVYTGSLGLMDDCMQIIKGIELINYPDVVFVFIGEGKEKAKIESYVLEKKINNTFFIGLIPKTDVRSWLQHAYAAFVTFKDVPVLQTSSPNKMFDAFATGVPVIQSTKGWIKELFDVQQCGLSVDPAKPLEMSAAISFMLENPGKRDMMSASSKQLARTTLNRTNLAFEYLDAMRRILS